MTTFVLVHGSWHGGWCWDRLIPELEARGHRAVAMDLPIDDPAAGLAEYAEAVPGGHSPFLSRPSALAEALIEVAAVA